MTGRRGTPEERFWPKVVAAENGCIAWIGAINSDGYGHFRARRTDVLRGRTGATTAARYANRTTCKAGHRVEGDNAYLYTTPNGYVGKQCRACKAANMRRFQQRKKAVS